MKSGEAQELADEIRQGGGRTRKDEEGRDGEEGGRRTDEEGRGRRTSARFRASDIKSNNPHLAGGEKTIRIKRGCGKDGYVVPRFPDIFKLR